MFEDLFLSFRKEFKLYTEGTFTEAEKQVLKFYWTCRKGDENNDLFYINKNQHKEITEYCFIKKKSEYVLPFCFFTKAITKYEEHKNFLEWIHKIDKNHIKEIINLKEFFDQNIYATDAGNEKCDIDQIKFSTPTNKSFIITGMELVFHISEKISNYINSEFEHYQISANDILNIKRKPAKYLDPTYQSQNIKDHLVYFIYDFFLKFDSFNSDSEIHYIIGELFSMAKFPFLDRQGYEIPLDCSDISKNVQRCIHRHQERIKN